MGSLATERAAFATHRAAFVTRERQLADFIANLGVKVPPAPSGTHAPLAGAHLQVGNQAAAAAAGSAAGSGGNGAAPSSGEEASAPAAATRQAGSASPLAPTRAAVLAPAPSLHMSTAFLLGRYGAGGGPASFAPTPVATAQPPPPFWLRSAASMTAAAAASATATTLGAGLARSR